MSSAQKSAESAIRQVAFAELQDALDHLLEEVKKGGKPGSARITIEVGPDMLRKVQPTPDPLHVYDGWEGHEGCS